MLKIVGWLPKLSEYLNSKSSVKLVLLEPKSIYLCSNLDVIRKNVGSYSSIFFLIFY